MGAKRVEELRVEELFQAQNPPKSRPGGLKVEPGALQDAILKDLLFKKVKRELHRKVLWPKWPIPCASHVPPRCRWRRKAEGECQQGFLQKLQHNVQKCFQKSSQEHSKSRTKRRLEGAKSEAKRHENEPKWNPSGAEPGPS